ncbi:MAG: radical SAM protein [Promethearchaeota archaeon]
MDQSYYPCIFDHISFRRYSEINIYDLKNDDSYVIDDEAYELLMKFDGQKTIQEILEQYPSNKQQEITNAINDFYELNVIKFSTKKTEDIPIPIKLKEKIPKKNYIGLPYFKNLMLNVTEKCNLTCKHCYITNKNPIDFPFDNLKEIIKKFFDLQGIKIILTGGEPYLYTHLKELLVFLKAYPLQKEMLSNGVLIKKHPEILTLLKENYFDVYISIDGMKDTHNDFRNSNCFQDTIEGIKLLLENGINTSINTMVHKQNLDEFESMLNLINSLGKIKNWSIDIPTFNNSISKDIIDKYAITPDEGGKILKDYGWGVIYESEGGNYACGPNLMAIDVTGIVTKCGFFYEESVGNVHEIGLEKSWKLIQKQLNWSIDDLKCNELNCEFLDECRGGCRYRAYQHSGDIRGIDTYKCFQYGKLKNKSELK